MKRFNFKGIDWVAIASFVSGGGLSAAYPLLGPKGPAIGIVLVALAGLVRVGAQKTGAPASSIVEGAAVVPPDTIVTHQDTPVLGTNVSTTEQPIGGSNGNK